VITDAYALVWVVPPLGPYAGTLAGTGPSISDVPDVVALGGDYLELSAAWWWNQNWALEGRSPSSG
jgi:hypothetical protein